MARNRSRTTAVVAACAALLFAACTSGDDDSEATSDTSAETTAPAATGPAPGVTDDTIKVGVTFVDVESLVASGLNLNLGDHRAVYQALFDAINADGGINGRTIEPVFAPINPTSPTPAEEKCVELTEDEDVFVVTGFFLADAVMCPVDTHATAVVGGEITPERLAQAKAPWVTWTPDSDQPEFVVREFFDRGELDGTVGVWVAERDQDTLNDHVLPVLDELGVDVVQTAIAVAPADDPTAGQAEMATISQAFEAAGVDTVLLVGSSAQGWPTNMVDSTYRPQLLFTTFLAPKAFASNAATTDTSILEGSLSGGGYGPDQARFETDSFQECVQTLADAGVDTPAPEDFAGDPTDMPYQAAFQACPDVALLRAVLEAAGPDLNYGTFEAAIDGLEVTIPGDPEPRIYGPGAGLDGSPAAFLFAWDQATKDFVIDEG
jgi:hypothetical protein